MISALKALFFDQDGVIAETERDGHRVAFNKAFSEFGLGFQWNIQEYGDLLFIGGGKERLLHYLNANRIGDASQRRDLVETVHRRKTEIFIDIVENGELPPRPGVRRLMIEAKEMGLTLGICTTSQERSATAIRNTLLKDIPVDFILAGDVVTRKKPDPEIYRMALSQSGFQPRETLVVEDSEIGVLAAFRAGIPVIATVTDYTINGDLSAAELVLSSLGDLQDPTRILSTKHQNLPITGEVKLADLICIMERVWS